MAGRKPKPSEIKELAGNPGHRPLNDTAPKPGPGPILCPSWLTARAKTKFNELVPTLQNMRVLTTADVDALAMGCAAYAEYLECRAAYRKHGRVYETTNMSGDKMFRPRPEVAMAADAWRRWKSMLTEFGLTPSARTRVKADEEPDDEWSDFD